MAGNQTILNIPVAYKIGKVYSAIPTNGDGDFIFSRTQGDSTLVNSDGLIEVAATNLPRFNYPLINGEIGEVESCPVLLLEPSSKNIVRYSEDFSNAYWVKDGTASVSSEIIPPPDGSFFSYKISNATGGSTTNVVRASFTGITGEHTASVYVRSSGATTMSIIITNDLDSSVQSQSISLNNKWKRVSVSHVVEGCQVSFGLSDGDFLVWGAQLEKQSFATSYMRNTGNSLGSERFSEDLYKDGLQDYINDSEGVFYAEISMSEWKFSKYLGLSSGGTTNRVVVGIPSNSNNLEFIVESSSGSLSDSFDLGGGRLDYHKIAIRYKSDGVSLWVDGNNVSNVSGAVTLDGLDRVITDVGNGGSDFYGNIKEISYYNIALSDTYLEELTSYI
jgi:hypothetical protein